MTSCKRCGLEIKFDDNNRCINVSSEMPHSIIHCTTKPGCLYCPLCRNIFLQNNPCKHYKKYSYSPGNSESFFIGLIRENYEIGSFFTRRRTRKTSFDKMKKGQKCTRCGFVFPKNAKRQAMDLHEKECKLQTKII